MPATTKRDVEPAYAEFGRVVADRITIRGSFVGTRRGMAEALVFAADGRFKADIELQSLSSINKIFDRLGHGDAPSRVVLDIARQAFR